MSTGFGLPSGYLPLALLITSLANVFNVAQCFVSLHFNLRIYNTANQPASKGHPASTEVTGLSSRTFAVFSALTGVIRTYGAFHLDDVHVYRMLLMTYACAILHFVSEVVVFKTANMKGAVNAPLIVASSMTTWLLLEYNTYCG